MKNLIIIIATILSFTASAQTAEEIEMVVLVNQVRTNPKSFIPVVESYIKALETTPNPFKDFKIKGVIVTKKTNHGKDVVNPMIAEAKALIVFLKTQKSVKELTLSYNLYIIAASQAEYLDSIKTLTHNGPNGESSTKRFTKGFTLCGENCAIGTTATEALLLLLIDSGNTPKGHRTNIFRKSFTQIAVGNKHQYWVQDFGY